MPPNKPANGTYISVLGASLSQFNGNFTYDNSSKSVDYLVMATGLHYLGSNTSNGNALIFSIAFPSDTVYFNGTNFTNPGGKNVYSGTANDRQSKKTGGQAPWTATQGG
jgi:hypothetical protein